MTFSFYIEPLELVGISVFVCVCMCVGYNNALVAHPEEDPQLLLDTFVTAYKQLGLALNIKKTQILY